MATVPKYSKAQRIAMERKSGRILNAGRKGPGASATTRKAAKATAVALVKKSEARVKVTKPKRQSTSSKLKARQAAIQKLMNSQ